MEARSLVFGKPDGRLYYTGSNRFGKDYRRVDNHPEHARAKEIFVGIIGGLPDHLGKNHPFWSTKFGKRWVDNNNPVELANKQLYNHPDFKICDETD